MPKKGDINGRLELGFFGFRSWLWDQHFGPNHHFYIDLVD
jgi:hypothetical protein